MTEILRKLLIPATVVLTALTSRSATPTGDAELAVRNVNRAMALIDASWDKTMIGTRTNLYMADRYNTVTGEVSGPSDIWPLTAAVEAHCSLLEAFEAVKDIDVKLYDDNFEKYADQLNVLIDNLEYYRGTYRLSSYATSNKESKPYAVPRSSKRGGANVTGILNVYDDQMWLARELVRAYRLLDNEEYLELATYLTDYVLDGWDCWHDEKGEEYGGITWGPGYNSKHACSNAPIIQPLVWLSDIYKDTGETVDFATRDEDDNVRKLTLDRSEHYLDFACKVHDWQVKKLINSSTGVYYDMMGADGKIIVSRGYRQHVDCGGAVGAYYPYNTGTMIAGAAELYRVTGEERFRTQLTKSAKGALNQFAVFKRAYNCYDFKTDDTAENGFLTWFNDVLMRSYVDAVPYCDNNAAANGLNGFQTTLDYAFDNHNRGDMLPIHLLDGWGSEKVTKPFHQFAFASEYAMLAVYNMNLIKQAGVEEVNVDVASPLSDVVYNLAGMALGHLSDVENRLPKGLYIVGGKKLTLGK